MKMRTVFWIGAAITGATLVSFAVDLVRITSRDIDEERERTVAARRQYEEDHRASPETWRRCREVCGDSAALLPFGEFGRVTCSCVPLTLKPDARTVPK